MGHQGRSEHKPWRPRRVGRSAKRVGRRARRLGKRARARPRKGKSRRGRQPRSESRRSEPRHARPQRARRRRRQRGSPRARLRPASRQRNAQRRNAQHPNGQRPSRLRPNRLRRRLWLPRRVRSRRRWRPRSGPHRLPAWGAPCRRVPRARWAAGRRHLQRRVRHRHRRHRPRSPIGLPGRATTTTCRATGGPAEIRRLSLSASLQQDPSAPRRAATGARAALAAQLLNVHRGAAR